MAVNTDTADSAGSGVEPGQAPVDVDAVLASGRASFAPTSRLAVVVLVAMLAIAAALAIASHVIYDRNENRLLDLRVKELGLVLTAAVNATETPVASAAAFANATDGSPSKFEAFAKPYVGPKSQFTSLSLWSPHNSVAKPVAVAGPAPVIESQPQRARAMLAVSEKGQLAVVNELSASAGPNIGYAFASGGYVVYAQRAILPNRHSRLEANSAFADLDYAFYLGRRMDGSDLLVTDAASLPLRGRTAGEVTPFGSSELTLVIAPHGSLGGMFFERLPWVIAAFGLVIALAAALLTDRLVQRRRRAEELARSLDHSVAENQRLYAEQRGIAQELQHALLPEALPTFEGLDASVRYLPGTLGLDVGGDWYDVVALDPGTLVLVVGDVSGRGLRAATTMASLRSTAVAYAADGDSPGVILEKLDRLVHSGPHDYFATVLCARIEIDSHRVTVASAGHLAPLVLDAAGPRFVEFKTGAPIGAVERPEYDETILTVGKAATLIAYTDGLVERRGEVLDIGLDRLRDAAVTAAAGSVDELVSSLVNELLETDNSDDTAIVAVRWRD
jgi:serine phosphatase RsbU (regulator of sigma subunit)